MLTPLQRNVVGLLTYGILLGAVSLLTWILTPLSQMAPDRVYLAMLWLVLFVTVRALTWTVNVLRSTQRELLYYRAATQLVRHQLESQHLFATTPDVPPQETPHDA